ncbi:hypothetical protein LCGC14_1415900 [marine sediment metagenome]|uniref:Uncharacterized protein n=1 Tax=marine sediment metagenome TaxID=412755 RepID=A0A0F9JT97_9ZZZZ
MANGFIDIRVTFPKPRGRERRLIDLAEAIIEAGLLDAIDRIVAKWYTFVQRRTGESGARSNWNLAKLGVLSFAIQNIARTRPSRKGRGGGKLYAGFVHPSGRSATLEDTLVQRELDIARRQITANLLGLRTEGVAPAGAFRPTAVSFAQATLDILLRAFRAALPGSLAA